MTAYAVRCPADALATQKLHSVEARFVQDLAPTHGFRIVRDYWQEKMPLALHLVVQLLGYESGRLVFVGRHSDEGQCSPQQHCRVPEGSHLGCIQIRNGGKC